MPKLNWFLFIIPWILVFIMASFFSDKLNNLEKKQTEIINLLEEIKNEEKLEFFYYPNYPDISFDNSDKSSYYFFNKEKKNVTEIKKEINKEINLLENKIEKNIIEFRGKIMEIFK